MCTSRSAIGARSGADWLIREHGITLAFARPAGNGDGAYDVGNQVVVALLPLVHRIK